MRFFAFGCVGRSIPMAFLVPLGYSVGCFGRHGEWIIILTEKVKLTSQRRMYECVSISAPVFGKSLVTL